MQASLEPPDIIHRAHAAQELVWRHCSLDAAESDLH